MPRPSPVWCCPARARGAARAFAVFALAGACTSAESMPARDPVANPTEPDPTGPSLERDDGDPVRIKGLAPHLLIHRRRDGAIEQLTDGTTARAGDLVQMSYVAAGNRRGVVVSLDGRGVVTLHYPERPDVPATVVARGQHALDHAYELDDARSFERFILVTSSDEALTAPVVLAAARRLAQRGPAARHSPLPLPGHWQQSSVTLHKRP